VKKSNNRHGKLALRFQITKEEEVDMKYLYCIEGLLRKLTLKVRKNEHRLKIANDKTYSYRAFSLVDH
jgi:hypothetical protein